VLPDYDGTLIKQALDLATRMLPAFDTTSGLPSLWVNLAKGQNPADTNVTCTACAGTLLLEFGLLSALTGGGCWVRGSAAPHLPLHLQLPLFSPGWLRRAGWRWGPAAGG
jgi:hypothetical protein